MKRALIIALACIGLASVAFAQNYTYLDSPSLAVADFEVSMSAAEKEAGKQFYGQLISQALLSVLVQQNAASIVYAPMDGRIVPSAPVYDPGMITMRGNLVLPDNATTRSLTSRMGKYIDDYTRANDEASRAKAMEGALDVSRELEAYSTELEGITRAKGGQAARLYFPSIFKIYDKKYVENALQNGAFTTKDLYAKSVGAFNFADLDFLVLGNVYETNFENADPKSGFNAIGFNVRVLNTKRAEEVYSYSAVVRHDLGDLPIACAEISRRVIIDILNSHCGQFVIREGADIADAAGADGVKSSSKAQIPEYRLFWQPRQVKKDDSTVGDSDNSNKREIQKETFYWALPGQYVVSVYNKETQQIKEIPFSLAAGDIRNITVEKKHLDTQKGSIAIAGIGPATSYHFKIVPKKQREQYWWEIANPPKERETIEVDFNISKQQGGAADKADKERYQYRPENQSIVIPDVPLASYDITVTRNPPEGLSSVIGVWYTSTWSSVTSAPLAVTLSDSARDAKLNIGDFGLQEKKQIESPKATKVTFILEPGFGYEGQIYVNDGSPMADWFYWANKEKITISSEYNKDDWDARPEVVYSFVVRGWSSSGGHYKDWQLDKAFSKTMITPERDIVVFVDVAAMKAKAEQAANDYEKSLDAESAPANPISSLIAAKPAAASTAPAAPSASTQAKAQKAPAASTVPGKTPLFFLDGSFGLGYGTRTSTSRTYSSSSGAAITLGADLYVHPIASFGIGAGFRVLTLQSLSSSSSSSSSASPSAMVTIDTLFGDPSKAKSLFMLDVGFGSGFTVGAGTVFLNPSRKGGLTFGAEFMNLSSSTSTGQSFSLNLGYMVGF